MLWMVFSWCNGKGCLDGAIVKPVYQGFTASINKNDNHVCFAIIQSPVISDHSVFSSIFQKSLHVYGMERKKERN